MNDRKDQNADLLEALREALEAAHRALRIARQAPRVTPEPVRAPKVPLRAAQQRSGPTPTIPPAGITDPETSRQAAGGTS